jgi:hypothetical protein
MILAVKSTPSSKKQEKKHLNQNPLMKYNALTPKSSIFMARNIINNEFFSLYRNPMSLSPSITKKKLKNKENQVWY